jgi:hypothetical protein
MEGQRGVTIMSSFHDLEMVDAKSKCNVIMEPRCVEDNNCAMGGVDLKQQKLEPHLNE